MVNLLKWWRELLIGVLGLSCYLLYSRETPPCPTVRASEVATEMRKVEEKVESHQRVTLTTKKKNGDVQIKVTETQKNTQVSEKVADKIIEHKETLSPQSVAKYSIGAVVNPRDRGDFQVGGAVRAGGLPVWGTVEWRQRDHDALLGLRLDF